jgi:esterase/lipase
MGYNRAMPPQDEASPMARRSPYVLLISFGLALIVGASAITCRRDTDDGPGRAASTPARPTSISAEPKVVSFPTSDGGLIYADEYGDGDRGVVLAHGGRFNKESWKKQAQAMAQADFRVLAIDFRGYGKSRGPAPSRDRYEGCHFDVLAAVRHLHETGAKTVSVVGASFGGWAAAGAAIEAKPGEIDRLVLLSASSIDHPEKLKGRKLFISTRDDIIGDNQPRLLLIRALYDRAPQPKELLILDGSAHAQHIFKTDQGDRLLRQIVQFLSES